jgi:hypothetical protein
MGGKLLWYARRLRSMSPREILHRIGESRLRRAGRRIGMAQLPAASHVVLTGLDFDAECFARIATEALPEWRAEVARAQAGEWHFLGLDWPRVALKDLWHLDPLSGDHWPSAPYCFDINYRHQPRRGDIKYTWEVNRLQILPVAAALWRATGDLDARNFALELIASWLDSNPPFRGVNWSSGIELAVRIANILAALSLLGSESLPADLGRRLSESLGIHLFWLLRYPSRFSSANNHRIAELAAVYILGRVMPGLPGAKAAAGNAWDELMEETLRQIHPDGVGAEQSPTYTAFTLEWILLALGVARRTADPVPAAVQKRLEAAATVLRWMMDDAGQVPRIGDDDEGRVLISGAAREPDYVALVLSSLAASVERPDLAPPRDRAHLRQLWLGRSGLPGLAPQGAAFFDAGGYSVLRHRIARRNSVITMDHGPLGYLAIAAHGHADALSIWWHLDGQPVLADAGTYLYHSGGDERDRFRGTAVHNTLCLGDLDQSRISGAFNWSRKARAWRIPTSRTSGHLCIEAAHDGYKALGVRHQRKLDAVSDGYLVRDSLVGHQRRPGATARLRWVLHPALTAQPEEAGIVLKLDNLPLARIAARLGPRDSIEFSDTRSDALRLSVEPMEISPDFGVKEITTAIVVEVPAKGLADRAILTRIWVAEA